VCGKTIIAKKIGGFGGLILIFLLKYLEYSQFVISQRRVNFHMDKMNIKKFQKLIRFYKFGIIFFS
jgi:hypothetical protein